MSGIVTTIPLVLIVRFAPPSWFQATAAAFRPLFGSNGAVYAVGGVLIIPWMFAFLLIQRMLAKRLGLKWPLGRS